MNKNIALLMRDNEKKAEWRAELIVMRIDNVMCNGNMSLEDACQLFGVTPQSIY